MEQRETAHKRGFITIATGKEMYYQFAKNLLLSYKVYSSEPLPFAILCDRENEYTALFDDVIILENPKNSYFDKMELLIRSPYEETIFVDSDCLAYTDLNCFWEYFAGADDFSAGGDNYPVDSQSGLFWIDSIGEYKPRVHWKPTIHGGLFFIRSGKVCRQIYEDCQYILEHHQEYRWPDNCVDEPVFCLAMAANGCRAMLADPRNYVIPWWTKQMSVDIFTGKCTCITQIDEHVTQGRMVHWSVAHCKKPLYRFEVEKLNLLLKYDVRPSGKLPLNLWERLLYGYRLRLYGMLLWEFSGRVVRKIGRMLKILK